MNLLLPKMKCDANCGRCCGVVMCSDDEKQAVEDYAKANGIQPVKQGLTCPWYQQGTCQVYPVRPFPCHLFGHVPDMVCPLGYNRNVSPGRERRICDWYSQKTMKDPGLTLHEVVYTIDEVAEMIQGVGGKKV